MALPQGWTTITVGSKIVYDDHMLDLRTNADYLDNNVANRSHNSGVLVAQDVTADNDQYSTADNPHNATADNDQYSTADNPHNSYVQTAHYPGYDYTHLNGVLSGQNVGALGAQYPSNCTTIYNSQCESVGCSGYFTAINGSNYGTNLGTKN